MVTLIKPRPAKDENKRSSTRTRPRRQPSALKLAIATSKEPRRTTVTEEFLRREATKLSLAATAQRVSFSALGAQTLEDTTPTVEARANADPPQKRRKLHCYERPRKGTGNTGAPQKKVLGDILTLCSG